MEPNNQTMGTGGTVSPGQPDTRDLGFGARVTQQSRERLLNRDGTFNVSRIGLPFFRSLSLYHSMLTMSWARFYVVLAGSYVVFNILFAFGYLLCGEGALRGLTSTTVPERLLDAFFFSVQTSTTIGYGHVAPVGIPANVLVSIEAMAGLLGFALATGLLFARISKPNAKILYSKQAVVAPYLGITALEFRIANGRSNQLIQIEAKVLLSRKETVGSTTKRKFRELSLERDSVLFFPLSWTVVHPIDERSPLFQISKDQFERSDAEILVLLTAIDETYSQTVHSRCSYKAHEIVWGAKFSDMFEKSEDGELHVNLQRLDDIEMVEPLEQSAN